MIYLDNAATTLQKPPEVAQAVVASFDTIGNAGRGCHEPTLAASRLIFDTRDKLAQLFHAEAAETIAFTSNATESLNTAILGMFRPGDHVITTDCEHNSVLRPIYWLEQNGIEVTFVAADRIGNISYEDIESACQSNTKAIIITHASNVTGNVMDIIRVSQIARNHGILLVVDVAQTAGVIPIDVQAMGIDVLCFTGHKGLLGPQGTGGIYVRPGVSILPLKRGGSGIQSYEHSHPNQMPEVLEAGTLNGHGIAGLNAAVSYLLDAGVEVAGGHEARLATQFLDGISDLSSVTVYGDIHSVKQTGVVSINIGTIDSGYISDILWQEYDIAVRAGAHCAPRMQEALGTKNQGTVRFSFGRFNTKRDVDAAIMAVKQLAKEVQK